MAIATMQLRLYVTSVSGGGVFYQLRWTQGSDNWGTAVNATQADFESTNEIVEGSPVDATSVGYIYFDLDPADFDFGLPLYWSLVDTGYNDPDTKNSFIATQNHATTAWRPVLIITEAVAGGDNDTTLPVGTLTLTGNVPTAVTTNKNLTTLPNGALTLTGHASIATVTQKNVSALPLGTLALAGNNPSAATTNKHISALPSIALGLTGHTPTAATTQRHVSTIPAAMLTLTSHAPGAVVTQKHISALPSGTLTLIGHAPTASNSDNHTAAIPLGTLDLIANAPGASVTNNHVSYLGLLTLVLSGHSPSANTTDKNIAALPVGILTLTGYAPISIYAEDIDNLLEIIRSTDEIEPLAASEYNQIIHGEALSQFESVEILALTGTKQTTTRSAKPTTSIRASRRNFNIH